MKKRYLVLLSIFAICVSFAIAQGGFLSGAYFVNPTVLGTIPMCNQFSGGLCVYSPSGLVDNGSILTYKGVQVGLVTSGVTQITAGAGISLSPSGGTGNVTVTNTSLNNAVSGSGTYTTATSDVITVTGATSSSHCTFSPTNSTAAAATVVGYISSIAANAVTITHVATTASTGTVDIVCTLN